MRSKNRTSFKLWLGLFVGFIGTTGLVVATKPEPQAALQEQPVVSVALTRVERTAIAPVERAVGRLVPARRATLSFEVPGRVVRRLVEPGTPVIKGQALLALDDGDFRDRLEEAEAQYRLEQQAVQRDRDLLALAERNTVLQEAEVERLQKLQTQSLTSGSQLDTARQTLIQLRAEEARLRHEVRTAPHRLALTKTQRGQAARQLERTVLRAPFDGTVNRVEVDLGDFVSLQKAIVELVDLQHLDLAIDVRGKAVEGLQLGQRLTVTVGQQELPGRLHALQSDPDATTHTHALLIRLPAGHARPGSIAAVELPLERADNALTVPASAVLRSGRDAFVFRYLDGQLQRRPVVLGPRVGGVQVIETGIAAADPVVARDVVGLSDGQVVAAVSESG